MVSVQDFELYIEKNQLRLVWTIKVCELTEWKSRCFNKFTDSGMYVSALFYVSILSGGEW